MAEIWYGGERARCYTAADRWIVYTDESNTAFVALATTRDHSWMGGNDTPYPALELAAAIERWSIKTAGLNECRPFIDALQVEVLRAEAMGTPLEIVRARYLLEAMLVRVAIAQAEDAKPFTDNGRPLINNGDDACADTIIVPWEADDDS